MADRLIQDALFFLTTLDPVGTMALFAALTARFPAAERRRTAHRAVAYATAILLVSVVAGQALLSAMGIRLLSLQVAGGVILFLLGVQMLFSGSDQTSTGQAEDGHDLAVFPMAIPSIAGPGAIMAVIVRTDNGLHSLGEQLATGAVLLGALLVMWVALLAAGPILRMIGTNGATILVRVMGMILAALSAELLLSALGVPGWAQP
ncbi:MAG: MarC family protein [Longimicrobiales bacterium]